MTINDVKDYENLQFEIDCKQVQDFRKANDLSWQSAIDAVKAMRNGASPTFTRFRKEDGFAAAVIPVAEDKIVYVSMTGLDVKETCTSWHECHKQANVGDLQVNFKNRLIAEVMERKFVWSRYMN